MLLHGGNRKEGEAEDISANKNTVFNQIYNKHYGWLTTSNSLLPRGSDPYALEQ